MKPVRFDEKGQHSAVYELATAYSPKKAMREFVTNAIDARISDTVEDIYLIINPFDRRLVISDNGIGMPLDFLLQLPEHIGRSYKRGRVDKRGEKGLGLLGFASLGEAMHMISRDYSDAEGRYGYVRWLKENETIKWDDKGAKNLSNEELEKFFYGNFPHGTRVIIDRVDSHIMDKLLTIPTLKEWVRTLYAPALRKGIVNIQVGKLDKRTKQPKVESLDAILYEKESSSQLVNEIIPIEIKNEDAPGRLEVLLFIDPEGAYDKVGVYSKDVMVYESLAELTEFSKSSIWTSGKVSGYVNDYFNKLILGRDGINRNTNSFKSWYNILKEIEEKIRPLVEETKRRGKKIKEDNQIRTVFDALADVYKEMQREGYEFVRSKNGLPTTIKGTPVENPTDPNLKKPVKPGKPRNIPGPGSFVEDSSGYLERVVHKRGIPFERPQPAKFPPHEAHLVSKSEYLLGKPIILLNEDHEEYNSRKDARDNSFERFLTDVCSKEMSFYAIKKNEENGELIGDKLDVAIRVLRDAEQLKFRALRRLGIK